MLKIILIQISNIQIKSSGQYHIKHATSEHENFPITQKSVLITVLYILWLQLNF